LQYIFFFYLCE